MADEHTVYEAIAQVMRRFGYRDVTAAMVREVDEAPDSDRSLGVISMFATQQLEAARASGLLPPKES